MVLSRYHWDLITVWTGLSLLNNKAKIAFAPIWHTPIVHCMMSYEPFWCYPPKDARLSDKTKAWRLHTGFNIYILNSIYLWPSRMFIEQPIAYNDIITLNLVDNNYQFSLDTAIAVVIIGQYSELPLQSTKDEIIAILKSYRVD